MDNKEFQFLSINTRSLWEEGEIDNLEVSDDGVSLKKECTYTYKKSYKNIGKPVDFALDPCGIIFILDVSGKILYFDPNTEYSEYIDCIKFDSPEAIAISHSNVYVIDDNTLKALANVNYQIRWEIEDIGDVKDISTDSKEVVYILRNKEIYKMDRDSTLSEFIKNLKKPLNIAIDNDDFLYVLDESGKILKFSPEGKKVNKFTPPEIPKNMGFSGLAVDTQGNFYIGVIGKEAIEILLIKREEIFSAFATYISKPLDSNEEGCQWHKFNLDCEIPENTEIAVRYRISDDEDAEPSWSKRLINPKDALILSPKGQYIQFKIELHSNDVSKTPKVNSLRVYFPRQSYLRYLPAVYQEDEKSRDFLERSLSLFETYLWELEKRIEGVSRYFDTEATPNEFLNWLSTWLGIPVDENWSLKKRRELLKRAPELFKKRGTREGLKEIIEIYLEEPEFVKSLKTLIDKSLNEGTSEESLEGLKHICKDADKPIIIEQFQLKPGEKLGLIEIKPGTLARCYHIKTPKETGDLSIQSEIEVIPSGEVELQKVTGDKESIISTVTIKEVNEEPNNPIKEVEVVNTDLLTISRITPTYATPSCVMCVKVKLEVKESLYKIKITDTLKLDDKLLARKSLIFMETWGKLFGNCPYCFCVLLKPFSVRQENEIDTIRRIAEHEKPAHTKGGVVLLQPWFYLDMHTYLGINTILSKPKFILGKDSVISRDTVLADIEKSGQIDVRARVGIDTILT